MTYVILVIAALLAFVAVAFGITSLLPPVPSDVISFVTALVKLGKRLDGILPVHEELTFIAFAVTALIALWAIELAAKFRAAGTGSAPGGKSS